jgi:two-component system, sensor histidine kinase YesM
MKSIILQRNFFTIVELVLIKEIIKHLLSRVYFLIGEIMNIKSVYLNLSIKYKILVFFYSIVILVSLVLGFYSYFTSEKYVVNRVSAANLEVISQVNNSINFLQKDTNDISTYLCLDAGVRAMLMKNYLGKDNSLSENEVSSITNTLNFIMNIIASKSHIGSITIYGERGFPPYFISTDGSGGISTFDEILGSKLYENAHELNGSPLWFYMPAGKHDFIQNNVSPKVAMCRTLKNVDGDYSEIGFMTIGINESAIRNLLSIGLLKGQESIEVVDGKGNIISLRGLDFYSEHTENQLYIKESQKHTKGYLIDKVSGKNMLVTYSSIEGTDWKTFYMAPMDTLTKEINSIKIVTLIIILACLLFSLPLILATSSLLTSPIKLLLKSMKRFQKGNFDEKVNFKYGDEIGMLGEGYNKMVANIKELIDRVYGLQIHEQELIIKEREAELNALQAQINPHFLYNTLDTIFWKAYGGNENEQEISSMVFSLSKMFRLSLNSGKGFTSIANEKEMIEHYLLLQKIRFKDHLNYNISIDENILNYVIPKLIIQPFVENSILHGLEGTENGGTVTVTGTLVDEKLYFLIEDDGVGMSETTIQALLKTEKTDNINMNSNSGGYAVGNVNERLRLNFNNNYSLNFTSNPGNGTQVEIIIPAVAYRDHEEKI